MRCLHGDGIAQVVSTFSQTYDRAVFCAEPPAAPATADEMLLAVVALVEDLVAVVHELLRTRGRLHSLHTHITHTTIRRHWAVAGCVAPSGGCTASAGADCAAPTAAAAQGVCRGGCNRHTRADRRGSCPTRSNNQHGRSPVPGYTPIDGAGACCSDPATVVVADFFGATLSVPPSSDRMYSFPVLLYPVVL